MAITRPSSELSNKTNVRTVGNRLQEATAEDFAEIASLFNEMADVVDSISGGDSPSPHYGTYTSLALLQATYPTAEENAFAVIDAGTGIAPQIALWDVTDNQWSLQVTTATTTETTIAQGANVTEVTVTDDDGNTLIIVSGTFTGTDPTKLSHYSANAITREI